jgi:hypothetical protein
VSAEPTVAYHGTDACPEMVAAEGLRAEMSDGPSPCVWMALRKEDASPFGHYLWEVDLTQLEEAWPLDDEDVQEWQAHYGSDVPPSALRRVEA